MCEYCRCQIYNGTTIYCICDGCSKKHIHCFGCKDQYTRMRSQNSESFYCNACYERR